MDILLITSNACTRNQPRTTYAAASEGSPAFALHFQQPWKIYPPRHGFVLCVEGGVWKFVHKRERETACTGVFGGGRVRCMEIIRSAWVLFVWNVGDFGDLVGEAKNCQLTRA